MCLSLNTIGIGGEQNGSGNNEYPMDADLKKQFEAFCSEIGMTMTTAVCVCKDGCEGAPDSF